jgi:carbohydrate-selective porin OprB
VLHDPLNPGKETAMTVVRMIGLIAITACSSAFPLNRSVRTLTDSLLLWFAAIVLYVCSAEAAFCFGTVGYVSPGGSLPAADSPLPWEISLFGKCQARKNLADRGFTFWAFNQFHVPANVSGGIDPAKKPLNQTFLAANVDFEKIGWWEGGQFRVSGI